jgi:hypothetical protein
MVHQLASMGADVAATDASGDTCAVIAARGGQWDAVITLVSKCDADPDEADRWDKNKCTCQCSTLVYVPSAPSFALLVEIFRVLLLRLLACNASITMNLGNITVLLNQIQSLPVLTIVEGALDAHTHTQTPAHPDPDPDTRTPGPAHLHPDTRTPELRDTYDGMATTF